MKQPVREFVSGNPDRSAEARRKDRRPASSEIKAEIEALMKKIERELIELHAQADRWTMETK
jgi:hypothetical protein